MTSRLTPEMLQRIDLADLEDGARASYAEGDCDRAQALLREAVRRAPFRQDLRDLLGAVIEARIVQGGGTPAAGNSTLEALRRRQAAAVQRPEPRRSVAEMDTIRLDEPTITRPPISLGRSRTAPRAVPAPRRLQAGKFARGRRRGPVSAILLGTFFALVLVGAAGAGVFYYVKLHPAATPEDTAARDADLKRQQVFAQTETYLQQNKFALAIDQLESLPDGPERNSRLADIYMSIGNQGYRQDPPKLQAALDAYGKAVQYAPGEADYGYALAQVYYSLSRGEGDAAAKERNLQSARTALEAVIERTPEHIPSHELLARIAVAVRDPVLQQRELRRIIELSPSDSQPARTARDSLRSLGFKDQ